MNNKFIALLRGINVGGNAVMTMADLKKQFESAGMTQVQTYIQTGNVVFSSKENNPGNILLKLKQQFQKVLNHNGEIFILTRDDLKTALAHCPFEPEKNDAKQYCHLMFLSGKPGKQQVNKLMELQGEEYSFAVHDKILYYAYLREFGGRRRNINFEKVLGVTGTARTWKVIDKLIEMSAS